MFIELCRLTVVCTLCIGATALEHASYRLVVGDGGYARLLKPAPSLTDITLAAWINITQFPYGVAPILTAVSADATDQVAFFLRHDGLGVLWGGPPPVTQYQLDQVDRHPRTDWNPVEVISKGRQRRDAVDYSGGLGDIENIMADSRSGRSFDTWSPYSFVDVDTMGVADLEASASGLSSDLHLLPTRSGFQRSESYNEWTIVPYELTMQESDPYDTHLLEPEPRIITEPSGDDDFVVFNWNVPAPPKPSIPQSPNEWSPMWHSDEEIPQVKKDLKEEQSIERTAVSQTNGNPVWSSQVTEVQLGQNHWNPYRIRGAAFTTKSPQSTRTTTTTTAQPKPTTTTPRTTTQRQTTPRPQRRTSISRPSVQKTRTSIPGLTTPQSGLRWRASKQPPTTFKTTVPPTETEQNRLQFTQTSPNVSKFTTTKRPYNREPTIPRTTASTTRKSTRMPLWKLINQPSHTQPSHEVIVSQTTSKSTTTTTTPTPTSTTTITSTTTKRPTTTKPRNRLNLSQSLSSRISTHHPRPSSTNRFNNPVDTTIKPQISGQKSKVSIWSGIEDAFKQNKEQNHNRAKWNDKSQNLSHKQKNVQIRPHHVREFERAMEGLPTVKDGNTAVVYSVPITDVEAFNTMYHQYQMKHTPSVPQTTKAPKIYHEAIVRVQKEEEANENQLGENNLHLKDSLSYRFPNGPDAAFEETASPALLNEEAVLIPTEEPLPPTPSRSDISIKEDARPTKNSAEQFKPSPKDINIQNRKTDREPITVVVAEESDEKIINPDVMIVESYVPLRYESTEDIKSTEPQDEGLVKSIKSKIPLKLEAIPISTVSLENTAQIKQFNKPSQPRRPIISASIQDKPVEQTTKRPSTTSTALPPTPTPQIKTFIKTNAHSRPPIPDFVEEKKNPIQSNNFAVFHVSEDDIPYYPEEKESPEIFSVDELFQPQGILVTQEDVHPVAHYQEPSNLYHQLLPPEYKFEEEKEEETPRPIAYGGPVRPMAETAQVDTSEDVMFSADPKTLIEQGLLPQPVHYVSTQEEADEWMLEQYERQPQIEERVFNVESADKINNVAKESKPSKDVDTQENAGNFHFKKLPYDFVENQWYHIAFTWSSQDHQVGVYINGNLAGTLTDVLPGNIALEGGGLTILGQTLLPDLTDFDPTSQFVGEMSDVNMWGHRLAPTDIEALYQCRPQIPVSPALNWHELSMKFYSDVHVDENVALCGA